jgi:hypothetical protein
MAQIPFAATVRQRPPTIRIIGAGVLYFLIVFAFAFVLGSVRVVWLEPLIGPTLATLCEAPLLIAVMMAAALWVPAKIGVPPDTSSLVKMGLIALGILILADISVGTAIRGITWAEQFAYFATPAGLLYLGLLAAFTLMPALLNIAAGSNRLGT